MCGATKCRSLRSLRTKPVGWVIVQEQRRRSGRLGPERRISRRHPAGVGCPLPHESRAHALRLRPAACLQETRNSGRRTTSGATGRYLERVFGILDEAGTRPLSETTERLLREVVVEAHLATTLRKMSQGQKCSLRFYPEGALLRATGTPVAAGFSGDRLGNVLEIWADLGALERADGARFILSDYGRSLAEKLRAMRNDLLKAIASSKDVTNAIILTHNIDFVFLQTVVLAAFRKCGHPSITVFADAQCAAESFAHQAPVLDGLGVRYRVVPVAMSSSESVIIRFRG